MFRTFILFIGGLASLWAGSVQAQDAALEQLYGKGVHSYFSFDYSKAYQQLTAAIGAGSRDPRAYYFRGLANLKLGRKPAAEMDFNKGAELESRDFNKYYNVGRALERIQGSERMLLESYRIKARIAAFEEAAKLRKARYEAIKREEARVLLQQAEEGAAAQADEPAEAVPVPPAESSVAEPAPNTDSSSAAGAVEEKASVEKKDAGTGMESKGEADADNPFANKADEERKPAAEKKPAAEEDPFSSAPAGTEKSAETTSAPKKSILGALGKSLSKGITGAGDKKAAPGANP